VLPVGLIAGPRPREHRALPRSPGPVDRAPRPCRGAPAALLPQHHPPQANPPDRAVRVGRAPRRRAGVCPPKAHCGTAFRSRIAGSSSRVATPSRFDRRPRSNHPIFRAPDPLKSLLIPGLAVLTDLRKVSLSALHVAHRGLIMGRRTSVAFTAILLITRAAAASDEDARSYLSFVEKGAAASGNVVVRLDPERESPAGWRVQWLLVLRSPSGLELPIGYLTDTRGSRPEITLRLPPGVHRIEARRELPRRVDIFTGGMGAWDLTRMDWEPPTRKLDTVASASVKVAGGDAHHLIFKYDEPIIAKADDGQAEILIARRTRFELSRVAPANLPSWEPLPYPLLKQANLGSLNQKHLVAATAKNGPLVEAILEGVKKLDRATWAELLQGDGRLNWSQAHILARIADDTMVEQILKSLKRNLPGDDLPTLWLLGATRSAAAVPVLLDALKREWIRDRLHALYSLARIGDKQATPTLLHLLSDTKCEKDVRAAVVVLDFGESLTIALEKVSTGTGQYVYSEPKEYEILPFSCVRDGAIYALGQIGDPKAVDALLAQLAHKSSNCLVIDQALAHFPEKRVATALANTLHDRDEGLVLGAIAALQFMRATDTVDQLRTLANETKNPTLKKLAEGAIGTLTAPPDSNSKPKAPRSPKAGRPAKGP
jgi:PBS lyase HEAT-like repeat